MRQHTIQNNFSSGELDPLLDARTDFEKYKNGLAQAVNVLPLPQGGVKDRPSTRFVKEVKDSADFTRLIRFQFSTTQAYVIEAGDLYFRFYMEHGNIETTPGNPTEVVTPYTSADLPALKYIQNADTLYLFHQDYAVRKLTRTSHTAWTLTEVDFIDGPYQDENTTAVTITPSGTTGSITLTASAVGTFDALHVGSLMRIKVASAYGYVEITAFGSSTSVTATVITALDGTTATTTWRRGLWNGVDGFPGAGTFYEQRLIAGGSPNFPHTLAGSVSGDFENFTPGTTASDSFVYTLGSNEVNNIRWFSSGTKLFTGTVGGEFTIRGGANSPITPTSILVTDETRYGANLVAPLRIINRVLFVQRSGKKIYGLGYTLESDSFEGDELTILSRHLLAPGIDDMAYQQEPDSTVWVVLSDGTLASLTYYPKQQVLGWAAHGTEGEFESVASIPSPDGTSDETWCIVKRTIDGNVVRYVEWFDDTLHGMDSALSYSGVATTTVSGLDHLEGEVVKVVGDGAVYPDATVSFGAITIDGPAAEEISVGLGYVPLIETLEPELPVAEGPIRGRPKRFSEIRVQLLESLGLTIEGDIVPFRSSADPMDSPPPEFTGVVRVSNLGWSRQGKLMIKQTQPLPMKVLNVAGTLEVGE